MKVQSVFKYSTFSAEITLALERQNNIIIENNFAKGIECVYRNKNYKFIATEETIVSAGAINSPQLLMLSGIGPEKELKNFIFKTAKC